MEKKGMKKDEKENNNDKKVIKTKCVKERKN
jgi:hypothetical protein